MQPFPLPSRVSNLRVSSYLEELDNRCKLLVYPAVFGTCELYGSTTAMIGPRLVFESLRPSSVE
jgi:hypothetical protein